MSRNWPNDISASHSDKASLTAKPTVSARSHEPTGNTDSPGGLPLDRWTEIDLYWVDRDNIARSAKEFWDRAAPLFAGVKGERGVIVNIGWLADFVTEWNGDPCSRIAFPGKMHTQHYTLDLPNTGTTPERMENWRRRFEKVEFIPLEYPAWTYADVAELVRALKEEAARCGLGEVRVGTFVVGWASIYEGEDSAFARRHPEAFWPTCNGRHCFNPESRLAKHHATRAAFLAGVCEGTRAIDYFAAQWGDLSRAVGFDALVLRDSMLGMGVYGRFGPYGNDGPAHPAKLAGHSRAWGDFIQAVKEANPSVWLMGYSNSSTGVADWRVGGFDLESIAKAGFLDAFIEQTWSGAWNETGQRKETFWNYPTRGWTAQLAFTLLHGAILAESRVRHYTLVEAYDAWEPGDVIHAAPERLRWGIWAYSHAAVKTPDGLKFPSGTYVSWLNVGKKLLPEEDVAFLAGNINEAARDALATTEVAGPTLVYNRRAIEWQCANAPDVSIKEWIDEQAAIVVKSSVPILSATRIEYLPRVASDLFVFQAPVHLRPSEKQAVLDLMRSGEPLAIWGSPAGGIDPDIAAEAGLVSDDVAPGTLQKTARLETVGADLSEGMPMEFKIFHLLSRNRAVGGAEALYSVAGSPALTLRGNVLVWDPGEYNENVGCHEQPVLPITEIVGSPYPYALVARAMQRLLRSKNRVVGISEDLRFPVTVGVWHLADGGIRILACDTEEGFDHSDETCRGLSLEWPANWPMEARDANTGEAFDIREGVLRFPIHRFMDRLLISCNPNPGRATILFGD